MIRGGDSDCVRQARDIVAGLCSGGRVEFCGGECHFHPAGAGSWELRPSNNRNGVKPVAFALRGLNGLVIDGHGANLVFHGGMLPFWLHGCRDVMLRNFSIDWSRPFQSQGQIVASDEAGVEFELDTGRYPCGVRDGRLVFEGEDWESPLTQGIVELDAETGAPAYLSGDNLGAEASPSEFVATDLGGGRFRLAHPFPHRAKVGNILLLRHFLRHYPGIFIENCRNVRLEDVTIHHACGTAVISQMSEHLECERYVVEPSPVGGRMFSASIDAAHYVNCRGLVRHTDCRYSHQMDDPCNVHGINSRFHHREDARTAVFERVHREQWGAPLGQAGDRMQASSNESLLPFADLVVGEVEEVDGRLVRMRFRDPLPDRLGSGDVLENLTWTPDFHADGCRAGPNRARGFLVSTPGRVLIENSWISTAGAAIKISGDANYWFESGAVRDACIRNNTFVDCCYGPPQWGTSVIDIDPEIEDPWSAGRSFHRNIRVTGNTFRSFDPAMLYARSVDGIVFEGNRVERTETHPPVKRLDAILSFDACRNVRVAGNWVDPAFNVPLRLDNDQPPGCRRYPPQASLDRGVD